MNLKGAPCPRGRGRGWDGDRDGTGTGTGRPTRGDDADPEWAGHQGCPGLVLVHAGVPLRPANQAVQDLAEHAVSTNADDPAGDTGVRVPSAVPATPCSPLLRKS